MWLKSLCFTLSSTQLPPERCIAVLVFQVTRFLVAAMSAFLAEGILHSPGQAPKLMRLFTDGVVFDSRQEGVSAGDLQKSLKAEFWDTATLAPKMHRVCYMCGDWPEYQCKRCNRPFCTKKQESSLRHAIHVSIVDADFLSESCCRDGRCGFVGSNNVYGRSAPSQSPGFAVPRAQYCGNGF
jgi:hypothetical protein